MSTISTLNGRLPASALTVADTGPNGPQQLCTAAAASWTRMLQAGMPAGHLRSGYRTLAQQAYEVAAMNAGLTPAAAPVGTSQHGEGLAADVDEPARTWVRTWGAPYGWVIDRVPGEPWHVEYDITRDRHLTPTTPPPPPPAPRPPLEDDMRGLIEALYRARLGRPGSDAEIDAWTISAATGNATAPVLVATFDSSRAEPATVVAAFHDYLGRAPGQPEIAAWLASGPSIAAVRAGVAGSKEATARQ